MTRLFLNGLLLASLAGACTKEGRSLVPIDVELAGPITPTSVSVIVTSPLSPETWSGKHDWSGPVLRFGIYLPPDVRGGVNTTACGFDDSMNLISYGIGNAVSVTPGQMADLVTVMLATTGPVPDACSAAGGGMGGAGAGGTGGAAGTSGTGGTTGAGGAGGNPGTSGNAGTSGDAGTGGNAGTGGTGGTGGNAGTGGTGGAAGSGGASGTGGPGGTGGTLQGHLDVAFGSHVASVNLTSEGTIDWAHWGSSTDRYAFDHKATGGGAISNLTRTEQLQYADGPTCTWTDGVPPTTTATPDDHAAVYMAYGGRPASISWTVDATTTMRTLRLHIGANGATTLTAHLSDNSASDVPFPIVTNDMPVDVTFRAASSPATLSLTWRFDGTLSSTDGVDMFVSAATLFPTP